MAITVVMMAAEILAGLTSGSMALLADGLHMGSHAVALFVALFAYRYARQNANNPRFTFGTGKVNALGGYTGATLLGIFALWMAWESAERAMYPIGIKYSEALAVAAVGLLVNVISALLLRDDHTHSHAGGEHQHHDHNLRAAYLHVLADAATSVAAILALIAARSLNASWLDPLMGMAGAVLVSYWSWGLLRSSGYVLLDHEGPARIRSSVQTTIDSTGGRIVDWHCWAIAPGRYAAIVSILTDGSVTASDFKAQVSQNHELVHLTVEIERGSGNAHP
jgi:cation diffusion facilitator family transporter